jgi:hypothetical protein
MRMLASSNEVTKQRKADAGLRRPGNVDDACSGTTRDRRATLLRTICPGGSDKLSVTQQSPVRSNGLVERDFGHPFLSLHREMNRLFDMFHDRFGRPPGSPLSFVQSSSRQRSKQVARQPAVKRRPDSYLA